MSSGCVVYFFFFKQKTAYDMRISDWSSDVCSSDLRRSRCIKDRRNIPLVPGDRLERRRSLSRLFGKGAATQCVERLDLSLPRDIRQRGDHVQVGRIADDQCRLGIADKIFKFASGRSGIERQEYGDNAQTAEI